MMMSKFHGLVKTEGAVAVACSDLLGARDQRHLAVLNADNATPTQLVNKPTITPVKHVHPQMLVAPLGPESSVVTPKINETKITTNPTGNVGLINLPIEPKTRRLKEIR